jgi:hypothetical protein
MMGQCFEAQHDESLMKLLELREDSAHNHYEDRRITVGNSIAKIQAKQSRKLDRTKRRPNSQNKGNQLDASPCSASENRPSSDN